MHFHVDLMQHRWRNQRNEERQGDGGRNKPLKLSTWDRSTKNSSAKSIRLTIRIYNCKFYLLSFLFVWYGLKYRVIFSMTFNDLEVKWYGILTRAYQNEEASKKNHLKWILYIWLQCKMRESQEARKREKLLWACAKN